MGGSFSCGPGSPGRLLRPPPLLERPLHERPEPRLEHRAAAGLGAGSKRNPIKTQGLQGVNAGLEAGGGARPEEHPRLTPPAPPPPPPPPQHHGPPAPAPRLPG